MTFVADMPKRKRHEPRGQKGLYPKRRKYERRRVPRGMTRTSGFPLNVAGSITELKYADMLLGAGDVPQAGSGSITFALPDLATGNTSTTRVGRNVSLTSWSIRFACELKQQVDLALTHDTFRWMVVLDTQNNKQALTALSSILEGGGHVHAWRNLANTKRFRILHDEVADFNSMCAEGNGTTLSSGRVRRSFTCYKKFKKPLRLTYDGTAGVVTEMTENCIYLILMADAVGGRLFFDDGHIRIRYLDG